MHKCDEEQRKLMHCVNITMTDLSSYKTFNKLTLKQLMHKNANAEKKIGLKYI